MGGAGRPGHAHARSAARAHRWSYGPARDYLLRAGDLISAEQAERRVLILEDPGLPGTSAVIPSLYAGLQLILPGEVAPCHRHTQCALRFVMEGDGAFTAVDGEKAVMRPFDLVLTPNWQWHDHGNTSAAPMIWLDGLDIPTVRFYEASFAERLAEPAHSETIPAGDSLRRYGRNLRPMRGTAADRRPAHQPLFHYPYAEWRESLLALAAAEPPDPHLGHALEFINPADGGAGHADHRGACPAPAGGLRDAAAAEHRRHHLRGGRGPWHRPRRRAGVPAGGARRARRALLAGR